MKTLLFSPLAAIVLLTSCHRSGPSKSTDTSSSMWASIPSATIIRPGTTFIANPNPIMVPTTPRVGATTLTWHAPVAKVEIHIGSPDGKLLAAGGSDGHVKTGAWVTDNMMFYLQDGTSDQPTGSSASLALLPVAVR